MKSVRGPGKVTGLLIDADAEQVQSWSIAIPSCDRPVWVQASPDTVAVWWQPERGEGRWLMTAVGASAPPSKITATAR